MNVAVHFDPPGGRQAGWQVFDARNGLFLQEGPWGHGGDIAVTLPDTDGDYRVFVSSVDAEHGWGYDRGEPFLLLDAKVRGGEAEVHPRQTTMRALRLAMLPRKAVQLLVEPWQTLWRNRSLIGSMVKRDIRGRYRGSFGNMVWTVLNPLLLMLTYYFVFGVVLQTRFPGSSGQSGYVLYFLAGMLPWLAFSEAIGRAPSVVLDHRNFVKKLVFPVDVLPVNLVLSGLVTSALALVIFLLFLVVARGSLPWTMVWLPVYVVPQILLTMGVAWLFAAVGVYLRDLLQVNGFLLTLIFFLTPICYPQSALPEWAWRVLQRSPIFKIVYGYRLLLLEGLPPAWPEVARVWAYALIFFFLGYAAFRKLRRGFVDVM